MTKALWTLLLVLVIWPAAARSGSVRLPVGAGRTVVPGLAPGGAGLVVFSYRPADLAPDDPIVIVMHGVGRNARSYRDSWIEAAWTQRMLILVPHMTSAQFPGSAGYSLGNMVDRKGEPKPSGQWIWPAVEKLFDTAREATGSTRQGYVLYGHSAGAQFVHRYVLFADAPRLELAISANAGWYTLPSERDAFPYGLRKSPAHADLSRAFGRKLVVLLGDADTDSEDRNLRQSAAAMRQGSNRLERGRIFFATAEAEARAAGLVFGWRLETVPGVAHSNRSMAKAAARVISGAVKQP